MPKNTLTIRLTEAAVYLRTSDNNARRRVLKPIKITSIDLELQAKTSTSWPEGVGARRIDVQESHKVSQVQTSVFFRAGPAPRRTASVGLDYAYDSPSRPNTPRHDDPQPPMSARAARGLSADSSYFRGMSHDATEHTPPIPPYTPLPTPPSSSSHTSPAHSSNHLTHEDPAHALEDFRNALRAGLSPSTSAAGDRSPGALRSSASSFRDISLSRRPSIDTLEEVDEDRRNPVPGSSSPNRADARGRRARFSLTSVSSVLMEAVRLDARGRTREKLAVEDDGPRTVLDKVAGLKEDAKDQGKTDSWREFKKGTYTFPISFTIPPNAPPTLQCPYGTVVWRLKANVHRPGAFAARMTAAREVVVIAAPTEDDTEDMENILVERHWEQQLQYLISISGRSFPIGGMVPVTLTLMPLAKVKIHRFSIYLEGACFIMKHVVRTDPIVRMQLLSVKYDDDKESRPILPLDSNRVDALEESPLLAFTAPGDDLSELASEWMGPGPWSFHQELALPPSCQRLHFTNKNKRGNMCVTHVLKCVIRTGKRKLFDIVVQTPVHILSCRCSPEWTSLPLYSTSFEDPTGAAPSCPASPAARGLERVHSHQSSDSAASAAETSPMHPAMPSLRSADTLFARNALFERLMSGQESELGEAPPAYAT
ncbi:hypothetical protein B0H17DRAFT_1072044 [Mycena rosella]|uniref:Arrestin C-terminal-like domain-containing protein n=1 Tax=Mycena rosella TaxID=1033263 RepID=A0AAD7GG84_MYCRO|nr:hypothetical protein B0H17DRAFT_1072044 [Mycena rosella]